MKAGKEFPFSKLFKLVAVHDPLSLGGGTRSDNMQGQRFNGTRQAGLIAMLHSLNTY